MSWLPDLFVTPLLENHQAVGSGKVKLSDQVVALLLLLDLDLGWLLGWNSDQPVSLPHDPSTGGLVDQDLLITRSGH